MIGAGALLSVCRASLLIFSLLALLLLLLVTQPRWGISKDPFDESRDIVKDTERHKN